MKRLAPTLLCCAFLLGAFGTVQASTPTIAQWTIGSSIHNLNANTVAYRFPDTTGANNLIVCGVITGSGFTATDDKSNSYAKAGDIDLTCATASSFI